MESFDLPDNAYKSGASDLKVSWIKANGIESCKEEDLALL